MNTELQTERLKLRQLKRSDAPVLYTYWADPVVTEFMNIESFQSVEQATEMIDFLNDLAVKKQAIRYTICLKTTNQIIGTCGFNYLDFENSRAEIAYDLGKQFWGNGYAPEATAALLNDGFNELNLNRVEAKVEPQNRNSIKVLNKLGFSFEGTLRQYEKVKDNFIDINMYAKLKND